MCQQTTTIKNKYIPVSLFPSKEALTTKKENFKQGPKITFWKYKTFINE